ncbi:MAG TPA: DUF262 domain-containing protein [Candidatus Angelobacter sp.]|nr:DUF262 domain-containing protein [Candidatus Angelobacter sp.]
MIRYNVRSRYLVDLVNEIKEKKLILAPFFQRKLVWRLAHKVDFIKTILLGYPFPEIFISRGTIDLVTMQSTSSLVDGQQRLSTIKEFIDDKFVVEGKKYSQLTPSEKESFLKYEIAIIDLDLQQDDPQIIEIFKRLNRTFYALSLIEKLSTEYGSSEFMLTAKLLSGELKRDPEAEEIIDPDRHEYDPNITAAFMDWAEKQKIKAYVRLVLESSIFTKYEVSRQVHLMFTLNIMATILDGYYNRNEGATRHLDARADNFPERQNIVDKVERAAESFNRLRFRSDSFWYAKSNAFTLLMTLCEYSDQLNVLDHVSLKARLQEFADAPPDPYALAAREGVNNKKERVQRAKYLQEMFDQILAIKSH